jgi:hypothetical protein
MHFQKPNALAPHSYVVHPWRFEAALRFWYCCAMANCKLLAFLLCDKTTVDHQGRVTLHALFDGIVIPQPSTTRHLSPFRSRKNAEGFYVFYKIVADQQCRIALRVLDPSGVEITGNWRDSITPQGPSVWQAMWGLSASIFQVPGRYQLDLMQEIDYPMPRSFSLASTPLVVFQGE